jgi:hypothetical protein
LYHARTLWIEFGFEQQLQLVSKIFHTLVLFFKNICILFKKVGVVIGREIWEISVAITAASTWLEDLQTRKKQRKNTYTKQP